MKRWGRRLIFVVGFVAISLVLWWLLYPTTASDRIAFFNLVLVAVTACVVAWYTLETRRLREVTQRQSTLQVRPFLSLRYNDDREFTIHNIGKGVAREVRAQHVSLTKAADADSTLTVEWEPIDFIPEHGQCELVGKGQWVTREEKHEISSRLRSWMSNFGKHGEAEYEFVIDYRDITGQQYRAAFEVLKGRTTLLRDEPFPEDG